MILDQKAPLVAPCQPPASSRSSFTLSFLAPFCCFSSSPSNHPLLLYSGDSGSFLMSSEMWSRDHSETGRHRPPPNSHHSSIIYTLVFISGMTTFILKPASFLMCRNRCIYFDKRHLCFQPGWGIFCTSRINALRWKPVHVAHMTAEQQESQETTRKRLLQLDNSYTFTWAECCPDFDLQT